MEKLGQKVGINNLLFVKKKIETQPNIFKKIIETLDKALEFLSKDLPLADNAPGGMIEYRKSLVTSFFFKFFLSVQKELDQNLIDEADLSGISSIQFQ